MFRSLPGKYLKPIPGAAAVKQEAVVAPPAPTVLLADDGAMIDPRVGEPDPGLTDLDLFMAAFVGGGISSASSASRSQFGKSSSTTILPLIRTCDWSINLDHTTSTFGLLSISATLRVVTKVKKYKSSP